MKGVGEWISWPAVHCCAPDRTIGCRGRGPILTGWQARGSNSLVVRREEGEKKRKTEKKQKNEGENEWVFIRVDQETTKETNVGVCVFWAHR